ncbi:MAG: cupin [Chitinophagaceae bacterium]|nr:cupin [Chitinophagaceae bacterium]
MELTNLTVIKLVEKAVTNEVYTNIPVALVNDHVVRMSIMTEPYFWHFHPDSDESFLVLEGSICIDLEDRTIELFASQMFTIPKNVKHRTRPNGGRSVNLTFEKGDMATVKIKDLP